MPIVYSKCTRLCTIDVMKMIDTFDGQMATEIALLIVKRSQNVCIRNVVQGVSYDQYIDFTCFLQGMDKMKQKLRFRRGIFDSH